MPRVLLLATGDVIAYPGAGRESRLAGGTTLLGDLPRGSVTAEVVVEDVLAEPSWDTSVATMLALARRARTALTHDGFAGVVVTHGLDTVEETAFLTDLVLGEAAWHGRVVFTGAARRRGAPDADGPHNLACSIADAIDPALHGAVICLAGEVHRARWATVVDARSPRGLSSHPCPILARVVNGDVHATSPPPPRPPVLAGEPETDVALITTYPGMDAALLSVVVDGGSRGVVLEGTGQGNVPVTLFSTIQELTSWDIPVVVASRARTSASSLEDLTAPDGLAAAVGAIGARGLPAAKARYALMAALSTGGVSRCREWFGRL
jgi:L-asparaginase